MDVRSIQSNTSSVGEIVSDTDLPLEPEKPEADQNHPANEPPIVAPFNPAERGRKIHESKLQANNLRASLEKQLSENLSPAQEVQTPGILRTVFDTGVEKISAGLQAKQKALAKLDSRIEKEVTKLNPGDDLKVGMSDFVQGELRAEASQQGVLTYSGKGEKPYDLKVSSDLGFGAIGQAGVAAGGAVKAEATGVIKLGGALIYSFENSNDAARAIRIHGQNAALNTVSDKMRGSGLVLGPTSSDNQLLAENLKAIELSGALAGKVAAKFGVDFEGEDLKTTGLNLQLNGEARQGARLDLPQDGKPARITFFGDAQIAGSGSNFLNIKDTNPKATGFSTGIGVSGSAKWQLRIEQSYDLPPNIDLNALMNDPVKTLGDISDQIEKSKEISVKLNTQVYGANQAGSLGSLGRGGAEEIKIKGRPADLQGPLQKILDGNVAQGLRDAGDTIHVTARVSALKTTGMKFNPEVSLFGIGVGGEMVFERTSRKTLLEIDGTPTEAYDWLVKNGNQPIQNPAMHQRVRNQTAP
jgi:hypothetical protein